VLSPSQQQAAGWAAWSSTFSVAVSVPQQPGLLLFSAENVGLSASTV
jgi:hypothetical protein